MAEVAEIEVKPDPELPVGETGEEEKVEEKKEKSKPKKKTIRIKKALTDKTKMKVTEIPEITSDGIEQIYFQDVWPPYSFVRVTMVKKTKEYTYEVIEPELDKGEIRLLKFLHY